MNEYTLYYYEGSYIIKTICEPKIVPRKDDYVVIEQQHYKVKSVFLHLNEEYIDVNLVRTF